ncbi:hypothetical protein ACWFR5_43090 [Streptomyces sp. NPDC055092]
MRFSEGRMTGLWREWRDKGLAGQKFGEWVDRYRDEGGVVTLSESAGDGTWTVRRTWPPDAS